MSSEKPLDEQSEKFSTLVSSLKSQIADVLSVVHKLRKRSNTEEADSSVGMSFLELKNHVMLNYLQNLVLVMLKKTSGLAIAQDPAVDRIVEIRTVLEKMRPMEVKLKYHIDKLMKAALDENVDKTDPARFRPNPDQLLNALGGPQEAAEGSDVETDEEIVDDEDEGDKAPHASDRRGNVYVPPRLAAVPYNMDETPKDRLQKDTERAKKRALHSTIMQELRQEYYDEPEEVHDRDIYRMKADKSAREREDYEERNMVRLNVSKKDKARTKKMTTMGSLSQLADFQDFRPMTRNDDVDEANFGAKIKKRKKSQKHKGKKSKRTKRHK